MIKTLKKIYKNKLIENVDVIDDKHFYFYKPLSLELFAISNDISIEEYQLLKMQYIEKKIYSIDNSINQIYSYVLENGKYPFSQKMKILIYKTDNDDGKIVFDILNKIYKVCYQIYIYDYNVCFYYEEYEQKINELFDTISYDLGYDIIVHEGIIINSDACGKNVLMYINAYCKNSNLNHQRYTDIADFILECGNVNSMEILNFLFNLIYIPVFKDQNKDILNVMIKNDLNVSSTSKYLYMNRNSLINKLDIIYKKTGFNLQKFKHSCAIYILSKINKQNV